MLHFPSPDIGMFGRRQRHARGHRIPVTIVARPHAAGDGDTAIVIDTFGADDVAPLPGGCACCTVRVKLQDALRRLLAEREQEAISRASRSRPARTSARSCARSRASARSAADFYVEARADRSSGNAASR